MHAVVFKGEIEALCTTWPYQAVKLERLTDYVELHFGDGCPKSDATLLISIVFFLLCFNCLGTSVDVPGPRMPVVLASSGIPLTLPSIRQGRQSKLKENAIFVS